MSARRQQLFIVGATTLEAAVRALMDLDDVCVRCVVSSAPAVATLAAPKGHPDRVATTLAAYLRERFGSSVTITPPTFGRALLGREPWMRVALEKPEVRLSEVHYPAALFAHEMLFACVDLERPLAAGERPVVAAGLWARFAKPMQRIGALLSDEREGLAAELALGIVARRHIAAGMVDGIAVAISSPDPIATELAGRALLRLRGDVFPGQQAVGPWETDLVQRAMEIGLGQVRSPEQLAPVTRWAGPPQRAAVFADVLARMADLLGTPREAMVAATPAGA
jgi:hypothetical protein